MSIATGLVVEHVFLTANAIHTKPPKVLYNANFSASYPIVMLRIKLLINVILNFMTSLYFSRKVYFH